MDNDMMSLVHFIKPFDPEIWYCLLISMSLTVMLITAAIMLFNATNGEEFDTLSFSLLIVFSNMLENPTNVAERVLRRCSSIRFSILIWSLSILVLGHAYKGIVTSELVVPPDKYQLETFEQAMVLNLSVYSLLNKNLINILDALKKNQQTSISKTSRLLQFFPSVKL
jgi:hypothetical protein